MKSETIVDIQQSNKMFEKTWWFSKIVYGFTPLIRRESFGKVSFEPFGLTLVYLLFRQSALPDWKSFLNRFGVPSCFKTSILVQFEWIAIKTVPIIAET